MSEILLSPGNLVFPPCFPKHFDGAPGSLEGGGKTQTAGGKTKRVGGNSKKVGERTRCIHTHLTVSPSVIVFPPSFPRYPGVSPGSVGGGGKP